MNLTKEQKQKLWRSYQKIHDYLNFRTHRKPGDHSNGPALGGYSWSAHMQVVDVWNALNGQNSKEGRVIGDLTNEEVVEKVRDFIEKVSYRREHSAIMSHRQSGNVLEALEKNILPILLDHAKENPQGFDSPFDDDPKDIIRAGRNYKFTDGIIRQEDKISGKAQKEDFAGDLPPRLYEAPKGKLPTIAEESELNTSYEETPKKSF